MNRLDNIGLAIDRFFYKTDKIMIEAITPIVILCYVFALYSVFDAIITKNAVVILATAGFILIALIFQFMLRPILQWLIDKAEAKQKTSQTKQN